MADVLEASQLKRLKEHKYSATGTSLMEPAMQVFWRWLVEQIPLWWAPNAITLIGLIINVSSSIILVYYSPDAKQEVPAFAYVLCGVGLFIYQSLDAIDGKQARRTGSNTPLGELFDHGCDSVSNFFVMIATCITLKMGELPGWMFFESFAAMFMFYSAHWQTYASGMLRFGKIDVTEGQFSIIGIFLITAVFGESLWTWQMPILGLELRFIPVYFSIFTAALAAKNYFGVIFMEGGSGKNGSTIAGTSVLSPVIPIATLILLGMAIWQKSTSQLFEKHCVLFCLSFGMAAAKVTNKLVIAHMTKSEMAMVDSSFIGPGMLFLNQYFNTIIDEYFVLWMCFIFCTADLLWYSVRVCRQICDYLNIYCFSITKLEKQHENGADNTKPNGSHFSGNQLEGPITRSRSSMSSSL